MLKIYENYPILINAINFINISNTESNNLPYHGIDHLFCVFEMMHNIIDNNSYDIDNKKELYLASLFHDYAHSGGSLTDKENIINALDGLILFHKAHHDFNLEIAIDLIKATEFPYNIKEEDLSFLQKLMRDADLCYLFSNLSIVKLYNGLRNEFKSGYNTFLTNQFNFLNSVKFYNEYYNKLWQNEIKEIRLKELELLKKYV